MTPEEKLSWQTHFAMPSVGGFFAAYAILTHANNMACALTQNGTMLVLSLLGGNFSQFLIRIGVLAVYVLGIVLTVALPKKTRWDMRIYSLVIDAAMLVVTAILANTSLPIVVQLYPVFFAVATQWNVFTGASGYAMSSIFITNNTRQAAISMTKYCLDKNKSDLRRSLFYICVIMSFCIGAGIAYISYLLAGNMSIWFGFIPLALGSVFVLQEYIYERRHPPTEMELES